MLLPYDDFYTTNLFFEEIHQDNIFSLIPRTCPKGLFLTLSFMKLRQIYSAYYP